MNINIEDLATALNIIINSTDTYENTLVELRNALPNYTNIEDIIFLFLQAMTIFFSNPIVGKWSDPNVFMDYENAKQILQNTGLTGEQLAEALVFSVANIFMKAKLEPVYALRSGKVIFTATNKTIKEIYQVRKQIDIYKQALNERYKDLENQINEISAKYGIADKTQFIQDILNINFESLSDYFGIKNNLENLNLKYETLLQELN